MNALDLILFQQSLQADKLPIICLWNGLTIHGGNRLIRNNNVNIDPICYKDTNNEDNG